jgi:hypothetical protein
VGFRGFGQGQDLRPQVDQALPDGLQRAFDGGADLAPFAD